MSGDGWSTSRIGLILSVVAAVTVVSEHLVLPSTPSIPYHVMYLDEGAGKKGDFVNVWVPGRWIGKDKEKVLLSKRIACVAGEQLHFREGAHYCGEELLGRVLEWDSKGDRLAPFAWDGPVPEGKAFIVGTHERSYDSRYFGFIDLDTTRRLTPIF